MKRSLRREYWFTIMLLIEPLGIETEFGGGKMSPENYLLIEPLGIETRKPAFVSYSN